MKRKEFIEINILFYSLLFLKFRLIKVMFMNLNKFENLITIKLEP